MGRSRRTACRPACRPSRDAASTIRAACAPHVETIRFPQRLPGQVIGTACPGRQGTGSNCVPVPLYAAYSCLVQPLRFLPVVAPVFPQGRGLRDPPESLAVLPFVFHEDLPHRLEIETPNHHGHVLARLFAYVVRTVDSPIEAP